MRERDINKKLGFEIEVHERSLRVQAKLGRVWVGSIRWEISLNNQGRAGWSNERINILDNDHLKIKIQGPACDEYWDAQSLADAAAVRHYISELADRGSRWFASELEYRRRLWEKAVMESKRKP